MYFYWTNTGFSIKKMLRNCDNIRIINNLCFMSYLIIITININTHSKFSMKKESFFLFTETSTFEVISNNY